MSHSARARRSADPLILFVRENKDLGDPEKLSRTWVKPQLFWCFHMPCFNIPTAQSGIFLHVCFLSLLNGIFIGLLMKIIEIFRIMKFHHCLNVQTIEKTKMSIF